MKKIGIDIREASGEKTGKGWYTFHIVQALLEKDLKNKYILYTKSKVPGFDKFKNIEVRVINGRGMFWHRNVIKDTKKEGINIFFAPTSYIIPAFLPQNIKSIFTVHDLVAFLFPKNHNKKAVIIEKLCLKKALKKADKVLAVSENTKHDLISRFKISGKNIDVIPCAAGDVFKQIESESLQKFIKETNLPNKFFLSVGTLIPRKNYTKLLQAFIKLHKKYPNCHLIIVGGQGWDYENIYQIIRENFISKNVHLLGYLSNKSLVKLYNLALGLVFPSLYEGFGIPPLEAFKCGCPVIASNTSSIPEVVGDAALKIDPTDSQSIYLAMEKFLQDSDLRDELKEKGFKQAEKFSWEISAGELLKIIENVILKP